MQTGSISLPGFSAPPGFASVLNGLLDQNTNAPIQTSAGGPGDAARNAFSSFRLRNRDVTAQRTAAETGNPTGDATAPLTKPAHRKTPAAAVLKEATAHPDETQTLLPVAAGEQTGPLLVEPGGKDTASIVTGRAWTSPPSTPSLSPPLAPAALLPPSSAAGTPSQTAAPAPFTEMSLPKSTFENAPTASPLAFALQLSWQPPTAHPGTAPPSVSAATPPVGNSQRELRSPVAETQPGRASQSAPLANSTGAPIEKELVPQGCSEPLVLHFSGARASSPSEIAFGAKSSLQPPGPNTSLAEDPKKQDANSKKDAALANTNGEEVPAVAEEANRPPERLPVESSAPTDDHTPEQKPAAPGSHPAPDKSPPSNSPAVLAGDKATSEAARLLPGNASATRPATGPGVQDCESTTAADAGTKPSAKALGNLPAQKLSPSPGSHQNPGTSADGVLLGRPADPVGTPARSKAVASETPQAGPAATTEAVPRPPAPSIREVAIRLGEATSSPVDVQVAAKAGKVQVAVRTPDLDLAKSLQTNIGELVGRLEEKGFKTEAWTAQTPGHSGLTVRQPAPSTANQGHSDPSGSHGGQPDARGGQRQSGQRQPGRWEEEFQETLSGPEATGPTGGLRSSTPIP